jgi:integrase/recombinase XerC
MIQDMLCKFNAYLKEMDASPASIKAYLCDLRKFIRWYEDTTGVHPKTAAVIRLDIVEFRNYLERSARQQPATINRALASLSVYFTWAVGKRHILSNPVDGVNTIKEQPHDPKWLERHDLYALVRAVSDRKRPSRRDHAIIVLLIHTGLRVSQACRLDIEDLTIRDRSGVVRVRQGKGNKYRDVPLNATVRNALKDWIGERESGPLFTSQKGAGRLTARAVEQMISRYACAARLGEGAKVTPHVLRHTFCKTLIDNEVSIDQVAALAGHGNINTTAKYTKPSQRDLQRAVEKMSWE